MSLQEGCCPICRRNDATLTDELDLKTHVDCKVCGTFLIDELSRKELLTKSQPWQLAGLVRRSNVFHRGRPADLTNTGTVFAQLRNIPTSVTDRSHALLAVICETSPRFGSSVDFDPEVDFPLGFARDRSEFMKLLFLLHDRHHISFGPKDAARSQYSNPGIFDVVATGDAYDIVERKAVSPRTIFVSSTCYDLLDARAELAAHLEKEGHIVKMSDDPFRFDATLQQGSIEVCLENLRASDMVIVILDRRYGSPLGGDYGELSATHVEVKAAQGAKPVFTFVRDKTINELSAMKTNFKSQSTAPMPTSWILDRDRNRQEKLLTLYEQLTKLSTTQPNWRTPFSSIVDLKQLVAKTVREFDMRL